MALTNVGKIVIGDPSLYVLANGISSNTGFQMNASGVREAIILDVPESGNISKVGLRVGTAANPQDLKLSLQGVDSSGFPSGTNYKGSAPVVIGSIAANTFFEGTLATPATAAVAGDKVAIVAEFNATVGDVFITVWSGGGQQYVFPYTCKFDGTTWAKQTSVLATGSFSLGYDDGRYPRCGIIPLTGGISSQTYAQASTPNEYGLAFTPSVPCRCVGLWHCYGRAASADALISLFSGSSSPTSLTSITELQAQVRSTTAGYNELYFPSPQNLAAGTEYVLAMRATTSNNITHRFSGVANAAMWEQLGWPPWTPKLATRSGGAGAFTLATTSMPFMGPILDRVDNGSGSGGSGYSRGRVASGL